MADNVTLPGAGVVVGSDEVTIGAVLQQVQRVKLVDGADGGTGLIGGDATNGLDVDVTRSALPTGASTLAEQQTQTTSLGLIDDAIVADNAGFTDGTTKLDIAGYIFDNVAGTALTENDAAAARIDSKRAQVFVLEDGTTRNQPAAVSAAGRLSVDASGVAVPITDNSSSLTVDAPVGTPVFVRLSDGTAAIGVGNGTATAAQRVTIASDSAGQFAEDVGHTTGDVGIFTLAVREDTPTSTAGTTGDYTAITMDQKGRTWVNNSTTVLANGQVAPTNAAATLVAARATRGRLILMNYGAVTVYVGIATVTTANGFALDPGASLTLNTSALIQAITAAGTGAIHYIEEYD